LRAQLVGLEGGLKPQDFAMGQVRRCVVSAFPSKQLALQAAHCALCFGLKMAYRIAIVPFLPFS